MPGWKRLILGGVLAVSAMFIGRPAEAAAEVKLGKDFLDGVVEKLPPASFEKADKYRGTVHSYRLIAIDPRAGGSWSPARSRGSFIPR